MKFWKHGLIVAALAMFGLFLPADGMAQFTTYGLQITDPPEGASFSTHEWLTVKWTAYCHGYIPTQDIQYRIDLNGEELTYDYYKSRDMWYTDPDHVPGTSGYFTMMGVFRYLVPGRTYYKNPNSILTVNSGSDKGPYTYDAAASITIGIKMWYDPLPIPGTESAPVKKGNFVQRTTWGRIKVLYE